MFHVRRQLRSAQSVCLAQTIELDRIAAADYLFAALSAIDVIANPPDV
jgi:hypothetical protein